MIDIVSVFPTPVIVRQFSKHAEYVDKFQNFEKTVRKPDQWTAPLNTSFPNIQSDDPYIDYDLSCKLKADIHRDVIEILTKLNMPAGVQYTSFWYNAYYEGQGQECHNHLSPHNFNPMWSGVYFAKNCFPQSFCFCRMDYSLRTQQQFDKENCVLAAYYDDVIPMPWTDGDLVLFPPHLHHYVNIDHRNKDLMRLTFSFNVILKQELTFSYA